MTEHNAKQSAHRVSLAAGFTLIELIIAIALLMIVMLMIMQMFNSAQGIYRTASQRAEVFASGRTAMDVIESDLQRIAGRDFFGDISCLSAEPRPTTDLGYTDIPATYTSNDVIQHDTLNRDPNNQMTLQLKPILTFKTITSWIDPEGVPQSGLAQVSYYIKKRDLSPDADKGDPAPVTGYLMRYVIPVDIDYGEALAVREKNARRGAQAEIAGSVLDMKVWFVNNGAAAYMAQTGKDYEFFPRCDHKPTGSAKLLREALGQASNAPAPQASSSPLLEELTPRDGEYYICGFSRSGISQVAESRGKFPLAIMIEITFANDQVAVEDATNVRGTVRVVRRVISIPNTEAQSSLNSKDVQRFEKFAG